MSAARGTFQVTSRDEDTYQELEDGGKLIRARGAQRFSGDIEGESSVEWLMCYTGDVARFLGLQRITGSIGVRPGASSSRRRGRTTESAPREHGRWFPDRGTDDLAGLSGEGSFEAPGGPEASYCLEYRLD